MNKFSSIKHTSVFFLVLFLTSIWANYCLAQPKSQYPYLKLVSKNEQANMARYRFKQGNKILNLELKLQSGIVNVRMVTGQNQVIATGAISMNSTGGRDVTVTKTQDKLLAYWHFALDRTYSDGTTLTLSSIDSGLNAQLQECLNNCYLQELSRLVKADRIDKLVDAYNNTSAGETGGCEDISICTAVVLSEYDQCVQDCYDQFGD